MHKLPRAVTRLIESFERLPGVGPKSAQRLVFYLLHTPQAYLDDFATRLTALQKETVMCSVCHNIGEEDPCVICADSARDRSLLCVVEQPLDLLAIERSGKYDGLYQVLHGAIEPLNNIGPDQLYLLDILKRLEGVKELIIATNPTMEGEATGLYIIEVIRQSRPELFSAGADGRPVLSVTRIGHGLPIGADIEYADGLTLARALEGRRQMNSDHI